MKRLSYFLCIAILAACAEKKDHRLAITNVNIIDVETGEVLPNQTIAIDADTITEIYSTDVEFSETTRILDGTDKYAIPGLWDMHVHHNWNYEDANPLMIANGVVGVREMWGNMYELERMKKRMEDGTLDGPEVYTGSVIIDGVPKIWPGSIEVGDAEQARKAALEQIDTGVDFLKVYSLLSPEAFDAIAEVAREKGVPFAGHVPDKVHIEHAAKMGMVSAEHMYGVLTGASAIGDSLMRAGGSEYASAQLVIDTYSEAELNSMCETLVKEELWMCPTMITNKGAAYMLDPENTADERFGFMPTYLSGDWVLDSAMRANPRAIEYFDMQKAYYEATLPLVGKMSERGVKFLAGSDYPNPWCFPGFSLHDEMALMVEGGMDNLSALQTATINPAIFMEKEDSYGNLGKGKMASLVILDKNPLEDITNTQSISLVILRGKVFTREELDRKLEDIRLNLENQFEIGPWLKASIEYGGLDAAVDSLNFIIENENCNPKLAEKEINSMGYELMRFGDMNTAEKLLKKNVELFPESFNAYDSYAEVLMSLGNYEEARKNYQKALELNPYATSAKTMLDSLSSGNYQPPTGGKGMRIPVHSHWRAHLEAEEGHKH